MTVSGTPSTQREGGMPSSRSIRTAKSKDGRFLPFTMSLACPADRPRARSCDESDGVSFDGGVSISNKFALSELYVKAKVRSQPDDIRLNMLQYSLMAKQHHPSDDVLSTDFPEAERAGPGHFVRAWRNKKKLTQQQLADLVGMSKSHLSELETGDKVLSVKVLHKIADALEVQAGFIIDLDPSKVSDDDLERFANKPTARETNILSAINTLDAIQVDALMAMIETFQKRTGTNN